MQVVIEIPEEEYKIIKNRKGPMVWVEHLIKNGTPLPKGHGELKDVDNLKSAFVMWSTAVKGNFSDADIASIIYNSPTIIEADRKVEE